MKKLLKIFALIFLSLILIVFLTGQFLIQPIVRLELDNYLANLNSDIYKYHYGKLRIQMFSGSIVLDEVSVIPNETTFDSLRNGNFEDIEEIHADHFKLYISPLEYLTHRKIVVNKISIERPEIYVFYYPSNEKVQRDPFAIEELISDDLQAFEVNEFIIDHALFHSQNILAEEPDIQLDSISIKFEQIELDSNTLKTKPLGISFQKVSLKMGAVILAINEYYNLSLEDFNFELSPGKEEDHHTTSIKILNFKYEPNEKAFAELEDNKIRALSAIKSREITLSDLKLEDLIVEKKLNFSKFLIVDPNVTNYVNSNIEKKQKKNPSRIVINNLLESISCDNIEIQNASITIGDTNKETSDFEIGEVNIMFQDVEFNEETINEPFGIRFRSGTLNSSYSKSDLNEFYSFKSGSIRIDLNKGDIKVRNLQLQPKYSKKEFSNVISSETDRFDINVEQLNFRGLNLEKLVNDLSINLRSCEIINGNFNVYRDKWVPDPAFVYKPLPSGAIRNLEIPIAIDSILVSGSNIFYEQLGDLVKYEDERPGLISFNNLSLVGLNLTNLPERLQVNPEFSVSARSDFMNANVLTAEYRFIIPDANDRFYLKGELSSLQTKVLEPTLRNLLLIEIPDGQIHNMSLDLVGNDSLMTGTVDIEYENLRIDILKVKKPKKSSNFMNNISNTVLKKQNLRSKGKYVTGIVNAPRQKNKSVFNYSWLGVKGGLMSTMVPFVKAEKAKKNN